MQPITQVPENIVVDMLGRSVIHEEPGTVARVGGLLGDELVRQMEIEIG